MAVSPARSIQRSRGGSVLKSNPGRSQASALDHAVRLIHRVCCFAGSADLIEQIRNENGGAAIRSAIKRHDTAVLYDWLMSALSYQGISDRAAYEYMERHGQATWSDLERKLARPVSCPKLKSYWHFHDCRYDKTSRTCAEPDHVGRCPLPTHHLRNGRLNQTAYSLYLFIRDIADGDLVGWIDGRMKEADDPTVADRLGRVREALIEPLRRVYGVADKVLTMALSCILLDAPKDRPRWIEVGGSMIAIDTLVHNFLHRTGILQRFDARPCLWCRLLPAWRLRRYRRPGSSGADRCPGVQSTLPGRFSAVRAARDLAVLRSIRPRRLQRQSHQ